MALDILDVHGIAHHDRLGTNGFLGEALARHDLAVAIRQPVDVTIEVADNGSGIPVEDRLRVLERFVRLEKSRTEAGSGLGLALVAAVARLHRGTFSIEDNNPGVRAVLDLPAG